MSFRIRINKMCDEKSVPPLHKGRLTALVKVTGVTKAGVKKWFHESIPDEKIIKHLAEHFNVSYVWLKSGIGTMERRSLRNNSISLPVIRLSSINDNDPQNTFNTVIKIFSPEKLSKNAFVTYQVGNELEPIILDESQLIIDKYDDLQNNNYILVLIDKSTMIKKLSIIDNVYYISIDNEFKKISKTQIVGKLIYATNSFV